MTAAVRAWGSVPGLLRKSGRAAVIAPVLLLALLVVWLLRIAPEWVHNPDLSHGLFTPILFGILLHESRQRGPLRFVPAGRGWVGGMVVLITLSLLTLVTASLFAAPLGWSHTVVLYLLGLAVIGALAAALWFGAAGHVRIVPLNWIVVAALLLWLLSLPVPPGTYSRLTLSLQFRITARVLQALHVLGIPAWRNGNIIELANTTVGVADACSGVRSLLSCIYAGFFFSAAFVRHWLSRCALLVLAPLLALVMNFIRSLLLTLLANHGIDIEGTWHDLTGFAILGLTAVMLGALALMLEKVEDARWATSDAVEATAPSQPKSRRCSRWGTTTWAVGYSLALAWIGLFMGLTRPAPTIDGPAPDILSFLPPAPDGWRVATSQDLYRFSSILQTDHLAQRIYLKDAPDGSLLQITIYLAYWPPGQASVSTVATHTPDACWPGAGWQPQPTDYTTIRLPLAGRELSRAEYRVFHNQRIPQHVWFWHSFNHHVIREFQPRRPWELLSSVLDYGVRSDGEQLFVRISSNHPWSDIDQEPLLAAVFNHLQPYGL